MRSCERWSADLEGVQESSLQSVRSSKVDGVASMQHGIDVLGEEEEEEEEEEEDRGWWHVMSTLLHVHTCTCMYV